MEAVFSVLLVTSAREDSVYFPYRYYSPNMNRWFTVDPAGLIDGPNEYGYVGENPLRHIDKNGLNKNPVNWYDRFIHVKKHLCKKKRDALVNCIKKELVTV